MNQEGEDAEDNEPKEKKEKDEEHKEDSPEPEHKVKTKKSFATKFKRRPKSTIEGEKKPEEQVNTQRHSYHAGDTAEEDQVTKEGDKEKEGEAGDTAPSELAIEPKSKIRRSFNMKFKRGSKKDEKDKDKEAAQETDAPKVEEATDESKEQAAMEESLQSDPPKSRFGRFKRSKDANNEPKGDEKENKEEKHELETVDENAESGTPAEKPGESKPKLRKLNLRRGKQRPVSMSAADKPASNDEEEGEFDRDDQIRHSYHAGDLPPPPPLREYYCCYANYVISCLIFHLNGSLVASFFLTHKTLFRLCLFQATCVE